MWSPSAMKHTNKSIRPIPKVSRRSFTLLEIMIALLILVTAAGFIGWNVKNLIEDYRFKDEVTSFYHDLEVAQLCALALHSEIKVHLSDKGGGWKAQFLTEEMILEKWSKSERLLQHVASVKGGKHLTIDANGQIHPDKVKLSFVGRHGIYHIDCTKPLAIQLEPGDRNGTEESKI